MARRSVLLLGAHMSIAGGVSKALERGCEVGCTTMQIFTRNASRWVAKPLADKEIERYHRLAANSKIAPVVAHDSYLINLASPDDKLHAKSLAALRDEMDRAEVLGLAGVVIHPGAHMGQGEEVGLARIAEALDVLHKETEGYRVRILLETTSGQGTVLGHRFEHLAAIIEALREPERVGVCLDTCHIFAAGYDIRDRKCYRRTLREFDDVIGLERLDVIHINDSKGELGSRKDRHAHIGEGCIGLEGFRQVMTDKKLVEVPKILETPKGPDMAEDRENMAKLKQLAEGN